MKTQELKQEALFSDAEEFALQKLTPGQEQKIAYRRKQDLQRQHRCRARKAEKLKTKEQRNAEAAATARATREAEAREMEVESGPLSPELKLVFEAVSHLCERGEPFTRKNLLLEIERQFQIQGICLLAPKRFIEMVFSKDLPDYTPEEWVSIPRSVLKVLLREEHA